MAKAQMSYTHFQSHKVNIKTPDAEKFLTSNTSTHLPSSPFNKGQAFPPTTSQDSQLIENFLSEFVFYNWNTINTASLPPIVLQGSDHLSKADSLINQTITKWDEIKEAIQSFINENQPTGELKTLLNTLLQSPLNRKEIDKTRSLLMSNPEYAQEELLQIFMQGEINHPFGKVPIGILNQALKVLKNRLSKIKNLIYSLRKA